MACPSCCGRSPGTSPALELRWRGLVDDLWTFLSRQGWAARHRPGKLNLFGHVFLSSSERRRRSSLGSGELASVTPQVFGFHNCIAFHKHEHHSSHSCLYFACNMSMQHALICLFHNWLAYEMWMVQLADTTWGLILENMAMLLVYHDKPNCCNKVLKHMQHGSATFWWK
jgi:hypothetical protein